MQHTSTGGSDEWQAVPQKEFSRDEQLILALQSHIDSLETTVAHQARQIEAMHAELNTVFSAIQRLDRQDAAFKQFCQERDWIPNNEQLDAGYSRLAEDLKKVGWRARVWAWLVGKW